MGKKEDWKYLPCLVEITDSYVNWDKLEPKFKLLKEKNVEIGHLIVSFLITDKMTDYYQGWIEYKEK